MATIYDLGEARKKQLTLNKLRAILGDLIHRIAIPPAEMPEEELLMLPASCLKTIDDLTPDELDDLLQGRIRFCILK